MANFFYVRNDGTATGDVHYTSAKTGSWATAFTNTNQYYSSIARIWYGIYYSEITLVDGDVIVVSDTHSINFSGASNQQYGYNVAVYVVCVDDDNVTTLSTGAVENVTNPNTVAVQSLTFNARLVYGITVNYSGTSPYTWTYYFTNGMYKNCTFSTVTDPRSYQYLSLAHVTFTDCTFNLKNVNLYNSSYYYACMYPYQGTVYLTNCTFTTDSADSGTTYGLVKDNSTACAIFQSCDFSQTYRPICTAVTAGELVTFKDTVFSSENLTNLPTFSSAKFASLIFENCTSNNYKQLAGRVTQDISTSVYRSGGAVDENSTPYSLVLTSGSTVSEGIAQEKCFLTSLWINTSTAKTFTVEIAQDNSATSLTNREVFLTVNHTKATSKKAVADGKNYSPFSSTNHSSSSQSWVGLTTPTKQYITVTTSVTGVAGWCDVYINLCKGSTTLYICPKIVVT